MNPVPHHSSLAEEQASLWAARLDGSVLSAEDRVALDSWLAADPAHRALLSSYCQFSADLEQQLPLLAGLRDEVAETKTAAKTAQPLPWLRWPTLAGAALMAAAVLAVILWQGRPQNHFHNIATSVAQRQEITLEDGSHIELNARTAIAVELTKESRRVRLAGGEAFFHVSKDPARPFYVETPAGSVRVTGTQFNVRTETATALEVTVFEGSVQVRAGGDPTVHALKARDRLTRGDGGVNVINLSPVELDNALAWRQGRAIFAGTPLREALARYARFHGRNLTATDAAGAVAVGGNYSLDDLDGFLGAIEQKGFSSVPLRVTPRLDGSVQVDTISQP
ncbi:MAG TPA: FecR domain-containing protein [Lacunisphaera sp.]|nr:FecR domain-containing protein [Lacunisphaera sp.]